MGEAARGRSVAEIKPEQEARAGLWRGLLAGQGETMAVFPAEMVRDVTTIYKSHFDNRNSISLWHHEAMSLHVYT